MIKLLRGLLEFNPLMRLTAKDALKSKVFDDIRCPQIEVGSYKKIKQEINEVDSFDYEDCLYNKYSIKDYKKIL